MKITDTRTVRFISAAEIANAFTLEELEDITAHLRYAHDAPNETLVFISTGQGHAQLYASVRPEG